MNTDDKTFDAPTDPEELKSRLYGIVMIAEHGEEWYWDDPGPPPADIKNPYRPPAESPPTEKK